MIIINKVFVIGRLTQNPFSYATQTGKTYCKFTVAVDREYTSENGEKKTDFIECTCFSRQAEYILKYLVKGSLVAILGRLQTSKYYDDRSQKNIYTTEVITENVQFLDNRRKSQEESTQKVNENTVGYSAISSIKSNEIIEDEDYEQMGFNAEDDDFINSLPF